ncbi:MAG: hypothetical protein KAV00_16815 [Phycisphaerae bacterium]|nr:hypothetical protein [Phycisphaerae bacterium]
MHIPIRGLPFLGRRYRHNNRYRQITPVLLKYGFGDLVTTVGLHRRLGLDRRWVVSDCFVTCYSHVTLEKARKTLCNLFVYKVL